MGFTHLATTLATKTTEKSGHGIQLGWVIVAVLAVALVWVIASAIRGRNGS